MPAGRYDIIAEQGASFKIQFDYLYAGVGGTGINLENFTCQMQVRKSAYDSKILLDASISGLTYGGVTGYYEPGVITGTTASGGIYLNQDIQGITRTGGIYINVPHTVTRYFPVGRHFYDLELTNSVSGDVTRLLEGTFEVTKEVTR
jgi:hypothetical protein